MVIKMWRNVKLEMNLNERMMTKERELFGL